MKTYICNKQRKPVNVQIPKTKKKISKFDYNPELGILSELSGFRNLLLPKYNKDPITMSSSEILMYCFCDLIKKSLIINTHNRGKSQYFSVLHRF